MGVSTAIDTGRVTPKFRRSDERALHIAAVHFLRLALPSTVPFWHTPNGEHRDRRTAQKLKAFGTRAGVPDLTFLLPGGRCAFIEFKVKGGYLSPTQREFRDQAVAAGALYGECRSLAELEGVLTGWLCGSGISLRARASA